MVKIEGKGNISAEIVADSISDVVDELKYKITDLEIK